MLILLTAIGGASLSQTRPLKHGKMVANGTTYDVRIRDGYNDVYIDDDSLYDKTQPLIKPNSGATFIPEDFILVNTDKLLEIKRQFYGESVRADIRVTITRDGQFMGLAYILPKSPTITEGQFRTLDAQVRKHLKVSIIFPHESVRNKKYHGYTTKRVLLY